MKTARCWCSSARNARVDIQLQPNTPPIYPQHPTHIPSTPHLNAKAARDVDKELAEMTRARMGRTSLGRALLHHNPEVFEQLERSRCTQNKWAIPGAVLGDRRRNKWKAKRNG